MSDEMKDPQQDDSPADVPIEQDEAVQPPDVDEQSATVVRRRMSLGDRLLVTGVIVAFLAVAGVGFFAYRAITEERAPQTAAEAQIDKLEKQLEKTPDDAMLHFQLAEVYYGIKDYDKALDALDAIRSLEPTGFVLAEVSYGEGRIVEAQGDAQGAIAKYNESLKTQELAETHFALGNTYSSLKEWDKAIKSYERYLQFEPSDAGALKSLGAAYEAKGDNQKALTTYQNAAKFLPDDSDLKAAITRLGGGK